MRSPVRGPLRVYWPKWDPVSSGHVEREVGAAADDCEEEESEV